MSTNVRQCPFMSVYVRLCPPMSVYVRLCPSLSAYVRLCPSLSAYVLSFLDSMRQADIDGRDTPPPPPKGEGAPTGGRFFRQGAPTGNVTPLPPTHGTGRFKSLERMFLWLWWTQNVKTREVTMKL